MNMRDIMRLVESLGGNWVYHITHSEKLDSILTHGLRSSEYDLSHHRTDYGYDDEDAEPNLAQVVFFSTDRNWLIGQYGQEYDVLLAFDSNVAKSLGLSFMDDESIDHEGRAEILYRDTPFVIPPAMIQVAARYNEDTGRWDIVA